MIWKENASSCFHYECLNNAYWFSMSWRNHNAAVYDMSQVGLGAQKHALSIWRIYIHNFQQVPMPRNERWAWLLTVFQVLTIVQDLGLVALTDQNFRDLCNQHLDVSNHYYHGSQYWWDIAASSSEEIEQLIIGHIIWQTQKRGRISDMKTTNRIEKTIKHVIRKKSVQRQRFTFVEHIRPCCTKHETKGYSHRDQPRSPNSSAYRNCPTDFSTSKV